MYKFKVLHGHHGVRQKSPSTRSSETYSLRQIRARSHLGTYPIRNSTPLGRPQGEGCFV